MTIAGRDNVDEVLVSAAGGVGRIRLNRPSAIHALTLGMCEAMTAALVQWRDDPAVRLVTIDHASGRGFCAGGDIRAAAESGRGDGSLARRFFYAEYRLNHLLFTYPKPTLAFMDGITMGGGVGLAAPCRLRVATERTLFAMPETGIGLFPDVGGGWYLSRLPGRIGHYLALTGAGIDGADCRAIGLATHFLPSAALEKVKQGIAADPDRSAAVVEAAAVPPPPSKLIAERAAIDRLFASDRLEDILAALAADRSEWAAQQLAILRTRSPQACKVALRLLAESRRLGDFAEEMRVEYRVAARVCRRHDFVEGVRAVIVDRDNRPTWDPLTPEGVTDEMVDEIFAVLPDAEEWTPLPELKG